MNKCIKQFPVEKLISSLNDIGNNWTVRCDEWTKKQELFIIAKDYHD